MRVLVLAWLLAAVLGAVVVLIAARSGPGWRRESEPEGDPLPPPAYDPGAPLPPVHEPEVAARLAANQTVQGAGAP